MAALLLLAAFAVLVGLGAWLGPDTRDSSYSLRWDSPQSDRGFDGDG